MTLIRRYPYIFIFLCVFLVHGLSLLVTGVFWDGVISHTLFRYDDSAALYAWINAMGLPFYYYYIKLLWLFGYGWVCNLTAFVFIFFVATLLFKSLRLYKKISLDLALFATLIIIVFPGSRITMFRAISAYYILYALFFFGTYLALKLETVSTKSLKYYLLRLVSLAILWFSFTLKSFLCFYLVFFIALYILNCEVHNNKPFSFSNLIKFVVEKIDYLLLPFAFWLVSISFYKAHGAYAGYNSFSTVSIKSIAMLSLQSLKQAFANYITPFLVLTFGFILYIAITRRSKLTHVLQNKIMGLSLISLGSLALLLAIIPYVLVGKPLIYSFLPATRCNLLIPAAAAIFFLGFAVLFYVDRSGNFTLFGKFMCILLFISGCAFWTKNYLVINAWSAMQASFKLKLHQNPQWKHYSLYWIKVEKFMIPPAYADYAWSGYFDAVYRGKSRFAESDPDQLKIPFQQYIQQFSTIDFRQQYSLENLDPYGCQASMIIIPGKSAGNPHRPGFIGLKYLFYRYADRGNLDNFLNQLLNINFQYYPSSNAKNCRR